MAKPDENEKTAGQPKKPAESQPTLLGEFESSELAVAGGGGDCYWNGVRTSNGGCHVHDGITYTCTNGPWVKG